MGDPLASPAAEVVDVYDIAFGTESVPVVITPGMTETLLTLAD